jgi:hypothetical protein
MLLHYHYTVVTLLLHCDDSLEVDESEAVSRLQEVATDSRQQTADSRQQTADSRQQTADSRQQTAGGRRQTVLEVDESEAVLRLQEVVLLHVVMREHLRQGTVSTSSSVPV